MAVAGGTGGRAIARRAVGGGARSAVGPAAGRGLEALGVSCDGRHDSAVCSVRGLNLTPLRFGPTVTGTIATVLGHPGGGALRAALEAEGEFCASLPNETQRVRRRESPAT